MQQVRKRTYIVAYIPFRSKTHIRRFSFLRATKCQVPSRKNLYRKNNHVQTSPCANLAHIDRINTVP